MLRDYSNEHHDIDDRKRPVFDISRQVLDCLALSNGECSAYEPFCELIQADKTGHRPDHLVSFIEHRQLRLTPQYRD